MMRRGLGPFTSAAVRDAGAAVVRAWWLVIPVLGVHAWNYHGQVLSARLTAEGSPPRLLLSPLMFLSGVASATWSVATDLFQFLTRWFYYGALPLADMRMAGLVRLGPSGGDPGRMVVAASFTAAYALALEVVLSAVVLVALARSLGPSRYGRPNVLLHWWRVFRVGLVSALPVLVCDFLPLPIVFFGAREVLGGFRRPLLGLAIGLGVFFACASLALRVCAAAKGVGLRGALGWLTKALPLSHWLGLIGLAGAVGWLGRLAAHALSHPGLTAMGPLLMAAVVLWALAALWCLALMVRVCKGAQG
jgi:hypothetical protein